MNLEHFDKMDRAAVIHYYADMICKGPSDREVLDFNNCIIQRWSNTSLIDIKEKAWKEVEKRKGSVEQPKAGNTEVAVPRCFNCGAPSELVTNDEKPEYYCVDCATGKTPLENTIAHTIPSAEPLKGSTEEPLTNLELNAVLIVKELADWAEKYPRSKVYHHKEDMDAELIAIENKAKLFMVGHPSAYPLEPLHETTDDEITAEAAKFHREERFNEFLDHMGYFEAGAKWMRSRPLPSNPESPSDSEMLDWIQQMMIKGDDYCEIFFAGLRDGSDDASKYQIESNPEKFPTMNAPSVREAIKKAMSPPTTKD